MVLRGILVSLLFFVLPAFGQQEKLSPEVMDIIHNQVGVGTFTMSRDEFSELISEIKITDAESATQTTILESLAFDGRTIEKEVESFNQLGTALIAVMWALPEDITKWERDYVPTVGAWLDNQTNGPVMDEDDWAVNFIGHPLAGAFYFTGARQTGATNMESFGFSIVMSTVQWEFGNEALFESPSWQDLVITPVVGSAIGVGLYSLNQRIEKNDGKWMGSKTMGRVGLVITDPSGAFQSAMDKMGKGSIQDVKMGFRVIDLPRGITNRPISYDEQLVGFGIDFRFGTNKNN